VKTSHKNLKTAKMTRRKLKILKLQNTKTKTFKVHKKSKYPLSPLWNFTQMFLKTHKMTRRKIENQMIKRLRSMSFFFLQLMGLVHVKKEISQYVTLGEMFFHNPLKWSHLHYKKSRLFWQEFQ
jgi:hypothetical protein